MIPNTATILPNTVTRANIDYDIRKLIALDGMVQITLRGTPDPKIKDLIVTINGVKEFSNPALFEGIDIDHAKLASRGVTAVCSLLTTIGDVVQSVINKKRTDAKINTAILNMINSAKCYIQMHHIYLFTTGQGYVVCGDIRHEN